MIEYSILWVSYAGDKPRLDLEIFFCLHRTLSIWSSSMQCSLLLRDSSHCCFSLIEFWRVFDKTAFSSSFTRSISSILMTLHFTWTKTYWLSSYLSSVFKGICPSMSILISYCSSTFPCYCYLSLCACWHVCKKTYVRLPSVDNAIAKCEIRIWQMIV